MGRILSTYSSMSNWNIWTTAKSEVAALRVYDRVLQQLETVTLNLTCEPYWKTEEWVLHFQIELTEASWEANVITVIELGQRIGYEWMLSGDVRQDISGWSTKARITGVTAIEWVLLHGDKPSSE